MNNLSVNKQKIELLGKTYYIALTVRAINYIQMDLNKPFFEAVKEIDINGKNVVKVACAFLFAMLPKEARKNRFDIIQKISTEDMMQIILTIMCALKDGIKLDNSEDTQKDGLVFDDEEEHGPYDFVERLFTLGHVLGYTDTEIWDMTPRKILALHRDYMRYKSGDKPKKSAVDMLGGL